MPYCNHEHRERAVEYQGLSVEKCSGCNYVFAPKGSPLSTLYEDPLTALERAREEITSTLREITAWMEFNASDERYRFWKDEIVGKVYWTLALQKRRSGNTQLMIKLKDPSMRRIEHNTSKSNIITTRSLGNVKNLVDVEGVLDTQARHLAWKKIEKYLEKVVKAIE